MVSNTLLTSRSSRESAMFLASASAITSSRGASRSRTVIGPPGVIWSSRSAPTSIVAVSVSIPGNGPLMRGRKPRTTSSSATGVRPISTAAP